MSIALPSSVVSNSAQQEPLRVMVVDDSVVIRGMISRWVGSEPDMVVAASLRTGLDAVNQIERINPDVAVLDIEMPDLDGISALPLLLAKKRNLVIIMASTLTRRNAEISFRALALGASDYIPKPESTREPTAAETFRHDLVQKIRHLGAKVRRALPVHPSPALAPVSDRVREPLYRPQAAPAASTPLARRAFSTQNPRVLLIGSSTGGPQALMTLVGEIGAVIDRFPVLITQHMPPTFTTILAEHLARKPPSGARGRRWGDRQDRSHLFSAWRAPYARLAPRQRSGDCPGRRAAGQLLQAGGRSPVYLRNRCLAGRYSGCCADRHGIRRHARRQGNRRSRRKRDCAG